MNSILAGIIVAIKANPNETYITPVITKEEAEEVVAELVLLGIGAEICEDPFKGFGKEVTGRYFVRVNGNS